MFFLLSYPIKNVIAVKQKSKVENVAEMDRTNPLIESRILSVYNIVLPVQGSCGRVRGPRGRGGQEQPTDPQNTQRSDQEK